jgi:hypothetical protein
MPQTSTRDPHLREHLPWSLILKLYWQLVLFGLLVLSVFTLSVCYWVSIDNPASVGARLWLRLRALALLIIVVHGIALLLSEFRFPLGLFTHFVHIALRVFLLSFPFALSDCFPKVVISIISIATAALAALALSLLAPIPIISVPRGFSAPIGHYLL